MIHESQLTERMSVDQSTLNLEGLDPPVIFTLYLISRKLFNPFALCCYLT